MGERLTALENIISDAQEWESFSESNVWQRLKERIEKEIIQQAKDAFWLTEIDVKNNEQLLRNLITQRAVVRTALKIIDFVDGAKGRKTQAQREVEKIDRAKSKAGEKPTT